MTEETIRQKLENLYQQRREELLCDRESAPEGALDRPVFGEGCCRPALVLVGEAPGAEETKLGHPFVGKAGKQLDELLRLAQLRREDIYITNVVKYRPIHRTERSVRNRTPDQREIRSGLPLLAAELALLAPTMVATLGNVPLGALLTLCGEGKDTVGTLHGTARSVRMGEQSFILYPMYHPASVIYRRELLPVCEADAKRLGQLLRKQNETLRPATPQTLKEVETV